MNVETFVTFLTMQGADFGLKILGALAAWIVGRWLIDGGLRSVFMQVLRPFEVGVFFQAGGVTGTVHESGPKCRCRACGLAPTTTTTGRCTLTPTRPSSPPSAPRATRCPRRPWPTARSEFLLPA